MFDEAGNQMIMRLSFDGRVGDLRVTDKWKEKELVKQLWPFSFGWSVEVEWKLRNRK